LFDKYLKSILEAVELEINLLAMMMMMMMMMLDDDESESFREKKSEKT